MKRYVLTILSAFVLFSFLSSPSFAEEEKQVAIIIDDFGGNVNGVDSFLKGNIPVTIAVMPFLENTTEQAEKANSAGLEVVIHLPMEPKKGKTSWLSDNAITSQLTKEEIRERVLKAIENVPYAKGMNNHMGSKIVENEEMMRTILEVVKENDLYFIDSGTNSKSVIPKLAEEMDIPFARRDVFLDDTYSSKQHVEKQMEKLLTLGLNQGKAIAIGHVGIKGNETYAGISETLSLFEEKDVNIVPISYLLDTPIDQDHEHFWHPKNEEDVYDYRK